MRDEKFWIVTEKEEKAISSLIVKGSKENKKNQKFTIIDFKSFYKLFTDNEIMLFKKYLAINPREIGYKLPFLGFQNAPKNLLSIANQSYTQKGKVSTLSCQYLPKKIYFAYIKLVNKMQNDLNKKVLIEWGYRSPAYQVYNFFKYFKYYKYDFNQTISRVCFPDYSEHVCTQRQAIDFITEDGIDDDFDQTKEYLWLQKNANKFGFFESYPKYNKLGMMYEPWHWHYYKN